MDWVTKTRPDLSLTLLFPPFDLLESLTLLGIAVLDLTTVCFAGPIGTTVLNLQLSCKTTKPTLHYLHLSDFDTFIHAKLWGRRGSVPIRAKLCHLCLVRTSLRCLRPYSFTLCIMYEPRFQGLLERQAVCRFHLSEELIDSEWWQPARPSL